jgi:hypothetical protein
MTGTLILDGENNPDAVFIFQTASTLITAASGNISLIRGAQACNIFWKVGSAATLGAGSTFRGTIMAHDTITLGDAVTVDGRLLAGEQASGAGAVTLIHDTITAPTCAAPVTTTGATTTASTSTTATTTTGTTTTPVATTPGATTTPAGTSTTPATSTTAAPTTPKAAAAAKKATAAKKPAAAKKGASTSVGYARPPRRHVGLTG